MPWYKAGTVSVTLNSNTVIGVGTAFIVNSRVSDAFRGPDGGWYEIINVASDTALAIDPPYQGASEATGTYALAPMQGYVKDSADQLRAIVNTYGAKLAALGTTGNYDILPASKGGTGIDDLSVFIQGMLSDPDAAAARSTMVAAKSGANADITSLSGLTTALSVAQGGTGGATQAAARTGLGLGTVSVENVVPVAKGGTGGTTAATARDGLGLKSAAVSDILGTTSQSGGVPTGAIIERGVSSGGEYVKFADGTMICVRILATASYAFTTSAGSLWRTPTFNLGFGVTFAAVPAVILTASRPSDDDFILSARTGSITTSSVSCYLASNLTTASLGASIIITTIGRWF